MSEELKHTPTPWSIRPDRQHPGKVLHVVGQSEVVCGLDGIASPHKMNDRTFVEDKANMTFIVEACNSYYQLRSDLTTLRASLAEREEEVRRLREALEPFATEADAYDPPDGDDNDVAWRGDFPIGALRRARSALSPTSDHTRVQGWVEKGNAAPQSQGMGSTAPALPSFFEMPTDIQRAASSAAVDLPFAIFGDEFRAVEYALAKAILEERLREGQP